MNYNLPQRLRSYALLAVTGSLLLSTGCKKDGEEEKETITDNPNVEYLDVEDIVVYALDDRYDVAMIDIDRNGENDLKVYSADDSYDDVVEKFTSIDSWRGNGYVATRKVTMYDDRTVYMASEVSSGQNIKALSFDYGSGVTSGIFKDSGNGIDFSDGMQGKGDKYVGVRFKIGEATHFGWLKVNVDANALKITIKEWAYNKVAGESLNAGER